MPILKRDDIYSGDILDKYIKDVKAATEATKELQNQVRSVNKTGTGSEAKERIKLTEDLTKATNKLTVSEDKLAEELEKKKAAQRDQNKLNKANATLNDKLAGTEEKLLALNQKLRLERKKLNTETKNGTKRLKEINAEIDRNNAKIEKNSDKLKKQKIGIGRYTAGLKTMGLQMLTSLGLMGGLAGALSGIKNIIGATAEGQLFLAKVTGATNAVLSVLRDKLIDGWKAMTTFNDGVEDTRSFMEKLGDSIWDVIRIRGEGFGKFFTSAAKILKGDFKEGLNDAIDGTVALATGIEDATEKTKELTTQMQIMADFGAAMAVGAKKLALDRSVFAIQEAKDLRTINDLRVKAADKANFTAKERVKFINQALALNKKLAKKNEEFADIEIAQQIALFKAHNSNIDDEIKLNQIKKKADDVAAAALKKQKLLTAELQTAKREAAREDKTTRDTDLVETINTSNKIVQVTLTNEQKIADETARIKDNARKEEERKAKEQAEIDLQRAIDEEEAKLAIREAALNATAQLASDIFAAAQDERLAESRADAEAEKDILRERLDEGLISEEQFAEQVAEIEKKQRIESAKAEKKKALFDIAIATAVAAVKALPNLIASAAILAIGAIQAAAIAARPIPKFAEGGEIGGKPHSKGGTVIEAEKGEYVVNKQAYSQSPDLTEAINTGVLTDRNFNQITKQGNNMLLAHLLMQGNKNSNNLVTLMSNMGWTFDRDGERTINRADGSNIERFNI